MQRRQKNPPAVSSEPFSESSSKKTLGEHGRVKSSDLFETADKVSINIILPRALEVVPYLDPNNPITSKHRQQLHSPRAQSGKQLARLSASSESSLEYFDQFPPLSMSSGTTGISSLSPADQSSSFSFTLETNEHINAWMVPFKTEDSNDVSVQAYLIKLPPDYYDHASHLSEYFEVSICVRIGDPHVPSNRRNSFSDPDTGEVIATPKYPPIKSKTISAYASVGGNTSHLGFGHIARNQLLHEKKICPLDNNVSGSLPDKIAGLPHDPELTAYLQEHVSANIKFAYRYHEFVCWEEMVPEYAQIGDEYYEKGNLVPKYFIQEAHHIHWLINVIKQDAQRPASSRHYEFLSASTTEMKFSFKGAPFKIRLDILMPPFSLPDTPEEKFFSIEDFDKYVTELGIRGYHALLFGRSETGFEIPEGVCCGPNGHITPDADVQYFGKRFDMPRIAYAIFSADELNDHIRFIYGLHLLQARITCKTKQEFMDYVATCTAAIKPKLINYLHFIAARTTYSMYDYNVADNITDYLSKEEYESDIYENYADPTNIARFEYYQIKFLPAVKAAIAKYMQAPEDLSIVCTSDLYSLIMQVAFRHPLSIHAPEDTNLHAGAINANLIVNNDDFFVTENEASLLASIFSDRDLLKNQVISMNPYYLREVRGSDLSHQWLDIILIRCLNAAAISMFEFRMHWQIIVRTFSIDKKFGIPASEQVNLVLSGLEVKLNKFTDPVKRAQFIEKELDDLYSFYANIINMFHESLNTKKSWPIPEGLRLSNKAFQ